MFTTATTPATTTASETVTSASTAAVAVSVVVVAASGERASFLVVLVLARDGPHHHREAKVVSGPQARHHPRHHLRKTATLPGVHPDQTLRCVNGKEAFPRNSSNRAWALWITAIASSKVKLVRAERAMQGALSCKTVRF